MLSWIDRNGQAHTVTNLGQNVCNLKNPVWQVDTGLIEDKDLLPITSIRYGGLEFEAQKAIIKVGGLKCIGNIENVSNEKNLELMEKRTNNTIDVLKVEQNSISNSINES